MATSTTAVQPARAGRSARRSSVAQLAGIGARLARASGQRVRLTRPLSVLQIFRSVVDDPVGRAAPAPADIIIDRPSSIVAPNQNLRTNPLKRNGDVDQQPQRRPLARARGGSDSG